MEGRAGGAAVRPRRAQRSRATLQWLRRARRGDESRRYNRSTPAVPLQFRYCSATISAGIYDCVPRAMATARRDSGNAPPHMRRPRSSAPPARPSCIVQRDATHPSHRPGGTSRATCSSHRATRTMYATRTTKHPTHRAKLGRAAPYPLLAAIAADARASAAARACGAGASTLGPTGCGLKLAGDVAGRCAGAPARAGARPASSAEASRRRAGRERGRRYSEAALQPHTTRACEAHGCRTLYRAAACRALSAGAAGGTELVACVIGSSRPRAHATPSCCGIAKN